MSLTILDAMTLGAILEGIFYGAYMVLFILYLILRRRNHHAVDRPLTLAQILLFVLCTISLCLDILSDYFQVVRSISPSPRLPQQISAANEIKAFNIVAGSEVIFVLVDYLAQIILLYRCWIIWDKRWVVVAVPGFLALVSFGGGLGLAVAGHVKVSVFSPEKKLGPLYLSIGIMSFSISLGVNALTTSLLVTKILLISRKVRPGSGSDSHRLLRIITAMLIESGLLIFAFQLVYVVLFGVSPNFPAVGIISGPITQTYGITPMLLNLRVVMGSAYDKTTEQTRSLRFAHSQGAIAQTSGSSMSVVGAQSRVIDINLDDISNERATDAAV